MSTHPPIDLPHRDPPTQAEKWISGIAATEDRPAVPAKQPSFECALTLLLEWAQARYLAITPAAARGDAGTELCTKLCALQMQIPSVPQSLRVRIFLASTARRRCTSHCMHAAHTRHTHGTHTARTRHTRRTCPACTRAHPHALRIHILARHTRHDPTHTLSTGGGLPRGLPPGGAEVRAACAATS